MLKLILSNSLILIAQFQPDDQKFTILKNLLEQSGFQVLIESPPQRGAYGLLQVSSKTIWLNPVVFDLNIALPTLIHESVHAAQVCSGKGTIEMLGLDITPINQARPFFQGYSDIHRQDLEREAMAVQTHPNSFNLAVSLVKKYCSQ